MKIKKILFFSLAFFMLYSCKPKQQLTQVSMEKNSALKVKHKITEAEPSFKTADVSKMGIWLDYNDYNFNVSAAAKILKDSVIQVSIMPIFGFEAFKAEITKDSVRVFDKMNKRMYVVGYDFFNKHFGLKIDYKSIQDIISNRMLDNEKIGDGRTTYSIENGKQSLSLNAENKNVLSQTYYNNLYRIEKVIVNSRKTKYQMKVSYSNFGILDGLNFPRKINLKAGDGTNTFECEFNISKAIFNKKLVFSYTDQNRFERADIDKFFNK